MSDEHIHFSPAQAFMLAIGEARVGGAEAERKRIIDLLLAQDAEDGKAHHADKPSGVCRVCRAIALIKLEKGGENG